MSVQVLNTSQLETLRSLNEPGEPDLVAELVDIFVQTSPDMLDDIKKSVEARDFIAIKKSGHKLKGSSGNLGAEALSELCSQLEIKGANQDDSDIDGLCERIFTSHKEVVEILQRDWT